MKGPKDGVIKASFSGCSIEERETFHLSHAMILISVGQSYHENEKMVATLDLIERKFKKYTFIVADTLQRHNIGLRSGLNENESLLLAKKNGEIWIKTYLQDIQNRKGFFEVKRWDDYLKSKEFKDKLNIINKITENEEHSISKGIISSVNEYMRRGSRENMSSKDRAIQEKACTTYLKEECAIMLLWVDDGFNFEVYPTARNAAMEATYNTLILPHHKDILAPVNLRFKRYSRKTISV